MSGPSTFRSRFAAITGLAFAARLLALLWNDRLFGDVNLYALVAREWLQTGRLDYPLKFDYFAPAAYLALTSPVSQHPPAWSWLAGLLVKYAGLPDAFAALKLLSLLGGVTVVILGTLITRRLAGDRCALWAGLLLGLHPMLVDFSANGSPYIAVAAGAMAIWMAVVSPDWPAWSRGLLAAVGATVAWNFHGVGILLIPAGFVALALARSSTKKCPTLVAYSAATAVLVAPLIAWNFQQFGMAVHSTSTFYILGKLGLVSLVGDASGIQQVAQAPNLSHLIPYLGLALKSSLLFALHLGLETGFAGLALAAVGTVFLVRSGDRRTALALLIITLALALPCLGWPEFKYRFLILVLPLVIISAVIGFHHLHTARTWKWNNLISGGALSGILIFWVVQMVLTGSPAKYYAYDREHVGDYALVREASEFLKNQPNGTVLAFPDQLDGGVESSWWHEHPLILARGFPDTLLDQLMADFHPTYILSGTLQAGQMQRIAPDAVLHYENSGYRVYTLPLSPTNKAE